MAVGHQNGLPETVSLFADASNLMHAAHDIPAIMRVAVATAMQLSNANAAAAGLRIDDKLAFSEYCNGEGWQTLQCRYGAEVGWADDLIRHKKSFLMTRPNEELCFDHEDAPALARARQVLVVPVIGKAEDLLACLLLFDHNEEKFDKQDAALLEQLASMMSVAIDNGIQLSQSRRIEADLEKSVATYRTLVEQIRTDSECTLASER